MHILLDTTWINIHSELELTIIVKDPILDSTIIVFLDDLEIQPSFYESSDQSKVLIPRAYNVLWDGPIYYYSFKHNFTSGGLYPIIGSIWNSTGVLEYVSVVFVDVTDDLLCWPTATTFNDVSEEFTSPTLHFLGELVSICLVKCVCIAK